MTVTAIETDRQLAHAVRYQRVLEFYARQMRAMDEGDALTWAESFTPDGVFEANAHPDPQVGYATILAKAEAASADLAARGIQRRHWLHMIEVEDGDEPGTLRAQFYALILSTPKGGSAGVQLSCSGDDIIVDDGERMRVRHRRVRRDDLPVPANV